MKALVLLCYSVAAIAAEKSPPRQFTQEEARAAYQVSINAISKKLKAPYSAHFAPIEEVNFSPGGATHRKDIVVRLYVDSQNSFGAMLRLRWTCYVGPQRPDGLYNAFCRTGVFERE